MLSVGIAFFMSSNISKLEESVQVVDAHITGFSAEVFYLTGTPGYQPNDYFTNRAGQTTLTSATTSEETYINQKGEKSNEHYVIKGDSSFFSMEKSSGTATFVLTDDMNILAEKGLLYVEGSVGVRSGDSDNNDKIEIAVSCGDTKLIARSTKDDSTEWISTGFLKVKSDENIKFRFETLASGGFFNYCRFTLIEPMLKFKVVQDNFDFEVEKTELRPGEMVELNASNDILDIESDSTYFNYYKQIFGPNYEIVRGSEFASISNGQLLIETSAPEGAEIEVKASCKRDSFGVGEFSKNIVVKVVANKYEINIQSDFANPATFLGNGNFYEGQRITLKAKPKQNFVFKSWTINGEENKSSTVYYQVGKVNDIKANFVKKTKILGIQGVEKEYDGRTSATLNITLEGIESNHDVYIVGLSGHYADSKVQENKELSFEGAPELGGKDKDLYVLSDFTISSAYGTITKRKVSVVANEVTKIYGDNDEKIPFTANNVVSGEKLQGSLTRTGNEAVGVYEILIGNLVNENPNYEINFISAEFKIEKREVKLTFGEFEKIYDGTDSLELNYEISNLAFSDEITCDVSARYESKSAGLRKIVFDKMNVIGENSGNYFISLPQISGTILQKYLKVNVVDISTIFGDEKPLIYEVFGLIDGDTLSGQLSREEGNSVGEYEIFKNTLSNSNYNIDFTSGKYIILKRDVIVSARNQIKTYGDEDDNLLYEIENDVQGEGLSGKLQRESGEAVGVYKIKLGTLSNPNYNIIFREGLFEIVKRSATIEIVASDKVYDGSALVESHYQINNLANGDQIVASFDLRFESASAGLEKNIILENLKIEGEEVSNYEFTINTELKANIFKKGIKLIVDNKTKRYGESDGKLNYTLDGVVGNDELNLIIQRDPGENVGKYNIELLGYQNDNYDLSYDDCAYLEILPKELKVKPKSIEKVFGELDPALEYQICDTLEFDDTKESVFIGEISREEGENPGKYEIKIGTLAVSSNYKIIFEKDYLTILKRDIKITANPAQKIYGEEDPKLIYYSENVVEGYSPVVNLQREYGEDIGEYLINLANNIDPRYNITFEGATFTILPVVLKAKIDDKVKIYGESDPEFSISILEGELQFSDSIEQLSKGKFARETGESVGKYLISEGSFSLGNNYELTFENGEIEIIPAEIEIKAVTTTKKYGNQDFGLAFEIVSGELKFQDKINGQMEREPGEEVGEYNVTQGTICLNENYILTFVPGKFIIEKRPIKIIAKPQTKIYGEDDPLFEYEIEGGIVDQDVLVGHLFREIDYQNIQATENVGKYIILSDFENPNYEIEYVSNYLIIRQREIKITIDNKTKTYGQEDPELTYNIEEGFDLSGMSFSGGIYRVPGNDAGKYDIRSNLSLGRNYKIVYKKGVFEILPIDIKVKTQNYEKVYGESTPVFEYEIIEGQVLEGETLLGGISKEPGEDVGRYKLISAFSNTNYNVIVSDNYLTIKQKNVYLSFAIQDKVYNGDNVAYLKQMVVTGLIDESVTLCYDKENSARFKDVGPADNIEVDVYGITLEGEKSGNYILNYSKKATGNITKNILVAENEGVALKTNSSTELTNNSILKVEKSEDPNETESANKQFVDSFKIWIEDNGQKTHLQSPITISFDLPKEFEGRENYYVYGENKEGQKILLNCIVKEGKLEVVTDCLGEFVVLTDDESWLDICLYVSIGIMSLLAIWLTIFLVRKYRRKKLIKKA